MGKKKAQKKPKKKGPGQPPKPANKRRTIIKEVSFSPEEWAELEKLRGAEKAATFIRRDDRQRTKIALVATAHYLVRVMWAMLKRGTVWEEDTALAALVGTQAPAARN